MVVKWYNKGSAHLERHRQHAQHQLTNMQLHKTSPGTFSCLFHGNIWFFTARKHIKSMNVSTNMLIKCLWYDMNWIIPFAPWRARNLSALNITTNTVYRTKQNARISAHDFQTSLFNTIFCMSNLSFSVIGTEMICAERSRYHRSCHQRRFWTHLLSF